MFLKRIEAKGFKSFANKTKILFEKGLTVVVGPNGSGKSNINDAIRWVLGETSKKNLRASDYKDMIFSGSDSAPPAIFTEVSLVFNNKKGHFPLKHDEVIIKRKVYRDKPVSEYFINNEIVRRRDVRNLLLGTGLGNFDLSIISQGSVTKITDAKPDDLKDILNEAAGVSKYQKQKLETTNKLDKVTQKFELLNLKLSELKKQLSPLIKQKEKAQRYLEIKDKLTKIELPILKMQLSNDYNRQQIIRKELEKFKIAFNSIDQELKLIAEKKQFLKQENLRSEEKIHSLTKKKEIILNLKFSNKNLINETDEQFLVKKIVSTNEKIYSLKKLRKNLKLKEQETTNILHSIAKKQFQLENEKKQLEIKVNQLEFELKQKQNKVNNYPFSVKKILENKQLFNEVYGTVEQLINFDSKYEKAIKSALGSRLNHLTVKDEITIKDCLKYLKENRFGSTTFIPADKVIPKELNLEYLNVFKRFKGFLGTLSNFITTKALYKNVIKNLAGKIILFDSIENSLFAAKQSNYRFTFVTLEGDIIYPGFIVRGGSTPRSEKEVILKLKQVYKEFQQELKEKNIVYNELLYAVEKQKNLQLISNTEYIRINDRITYYEQDLATFLANYKEQFGIDFLLTDVETKKSVNKSKFDIVTIESKLNEHHQRKILNEKELIVLEKKEINLRELWKNNLKEETELKIELGKIDLNIGNNLKVLNLEYKLSYEQLLKLTFNENDVKVKNSDISFRNKLREEIKTLGFINLKAIEEYKVVATDYEELFANVNDLKLSREKLINSINELDVIMLKKFKDTFEKVSLEFNNIFKILFLGGYTKLNFLDPENPLTSGVIIEARTPGKQIKSLKLYSGGERSLIALSLIFAINSVKNLPILLLDEVEAALDEANVERFAEFAQELTNKTQLIVTSHRPGTMEKADSLYGVTMEEKGITKIVSIKLKEAKKIAEIN